MASDRASTPKIRQRKAQRTWLRGPLVRTLQEDGEVMLNGQRILIDDVSVVKAGDSIAVVIDTRPCASAVSLAKGAKIFLCESTYLEEHRDLAHRHYHLTAREAALIAKEANVEKLILTHFSARYLDLSLFQEEARQVFPNVEVADDFKVFTFPRNPR